jgi:hypothetical protein
MIASIFWLLTPVWVLLFFVLLLGVFAILSRIRGGRYVRPIVTGMLKIPLLGRGLRRLSESAMERSNPALASAVKKLNRSGAMRDPQRMQKALSMLTAAERRAWMEAAKRQQQQGSDSEVSNRQIRRQLEREGLGQGQGQGQKGKAKPKPKRGLLGRRKKAQEEEPQHPRRGQRPGRNRKKRRRR